MKKRRISTAQFIETFCLFGLGNIFSSLLSSVLSTVTGGLVGSLTEKEEKTVQPPKQGDIELAEGVEIGAESQQSAERKKRKGKSALTIQRDTSGASTGGGGTGAIV